LDIVC